MGKPGYELFCAAGELDGQELLIPGTEKSSGLVVVTLGKYQRIAEAVLAIVEAAEAAGGRG